MITQLVTLAILVLPFINPPRLKAICYQDPGCTNCHPPTSGCQAGEFQCTDYALVDYCCTESASECGGSFGVPGQPPGTGGTTAGGPPAGLLCNGGTGIDTALGCLQVDTSAFTIQLVKFIIGIAGGIAIIMMLIGTVLFASGGSNPEQVKRGKEIFTGALVGLLFIVFSVVILQIITRDILELKNFGP